MYNGSCSCCLTFVLHCVGGTVVPILSSRSPACAEVILCMHSSLSALLCFTVRCLSACRNPIDGCSKHQLLAPTQSLRLLVLSVLYGAPKR